MIPRFTTFRLDNPHNKGNQVPLIGKSDGPYCKFEVAQEAVKKFLTADGNDLCHENRRELAEAFGLQDLVPEPPKDRSEFRRRCQDYEAQLYGNKPGFDPDDPLWGVE